MISNNIVMKLMSYGRKMNISVKSWPWQNNLRIDGLKEVENETWEQTEQILKSMIQGKTKNWRYIYWKSSQGR